MKLGHCCVQITFIVCKIERKLILPQGCNQNYNSPDFGLGKHGLHIILGAIFFKVERVMLKIRCSFIYFITENKQSKIFEIDVRNYR